MSNPINMIFKPNLNVNCYKEMLTVTCHILILDNEQKNSKADSLAHLFMFNHNVILGG